MVASERNVRSVTLECCNQSFTRIVPDLDSSVVRCRQKIWLVGLWVVVDMIDTFRLMCLEGEIWCARSKRPDLDRPVETGRCECVCVLWINGKIHDIVDVSLKNLHALPCSIPIPQLDCHVIASGENERLCRVNNNGSDIVWVCFEGGGLLGCVVVVDSHLEVITSADDPVLSSNEPTGADRYVCQLECLDDGLRLV